MSEEKIKSEIGLQQIISAQKKEYMIHEKKLEILRHKNIIEELELMGKLNISHLDRRTSRHTQKTQKEVEQKK